MWRKHMFDTITHKLEEINHSGRNAFWEYKNLKPTPEDFFTSFVDLNPCITKIVEAGSSSEIENLISDVEHSELTNVINLKKVNNICQLEKFLQTLNNIMPQHGMFICLAETLEQRYKRKLKKYSTTTFKLYYIFDFIVKRLLPKWGLTRKLCLLFNKDTNNVLSLTHILGIFTYYGFQIHYLKDINNLTYFVFRKIKKAATNRKPSYGVFVKMERIGLHGKKINLYKLRTMHPYSEFIQQFVYDLNGSKNGDKIINDFRVTSWGRLFRKYWIDELPMFWNFIKGDLKIVGVRPLSQCKFNMYPPDIQKLRVSIKPGLIPPFYSDLPETFEELIESERRYLLAYKMNPLKTDIKYFCQCWRNIVCKRITSA